MADREDPGVKAPEEVGPERQGMADREDPGVKAPEEVGPERQGMADREDPGVKAVERDSPHEVGWAEPGMATVWQASCAASAVRSSRPRSILTLPAVRGSRGPWSFVSGLPLTDRSRPWRSCAPPDSGFWTRPRSRRSAAPPRIPSSGAGSAFPCPTAWTGSFRRSSHWLVSAKTGRQISLSLAHPLPIMRLGRARSAAGANSTTPVHEW